MDFLGGIFPAVKVINEIRIRNVDAAAAAKIDELAAAQGKSRNAYLKQYLESLAVLEDLKEQENRYASLILTVSEAIERNTDALLDMQNLLNELLNKKR